MKTFNVKTSRAGSALLTTMIVVITVSTLIASAVMVSSNTAYVNKRLTDRIRAKLIAEAGANKAYSILATNWDARLNDNAFPQTEFGAGRFDCSVVPVSTNRAVIYSTAHCGVAISDVILDIKNYGGSEPDDDSGTSETVTIGGEELDAYDFAILTGAALSWSGTGVFTGSKIHSNSSLSLGGNGNVNADASSHVSISVSGSAQLNGDATAPSLSGTSKISGTKTTAAVPEVPLPAIDLAAYFTEANNHGMVYSGPVTINNGDARTTPAGGILWINGDLTIPANVNVTGCFIATGKVQFNGNQTKYAGYPALVSRDGEVSIQAQAVVHGLVYTATGEVKFAGGGTLYGSIIATGGLQKTGNSGVIAYADSTPVPPVTDGSGSGSGSNPTDNIGVSAWQK